jgi:hypothetical protein
MSCAKLNQKSDCLWVGKRVLFTVKLGSFLFATTSIFGLRFTNLLFSQY